MRDALAANPVAFDVMYLDVPQVDVSSTQVRERIALGQGVDGMLPASVEAYVAQAGLYQDA